MRAFLVALACSGAIFGQAAFAQTDSPAAPAPSTSAQPAAPAATATAAPSQAATAAAATAPATVQQSADAGVNLDEIVCRNQPPATGTRLGGGRECHTVREWNQREREAQDTARKSQMEGYNSGAH